MMAKRGRPRSFDRDDALLQAMEVFWAKGYEGASIAELTDAMGIAAPSLYAAFGSKDGLFAAVVETYVRTAGSGIWEPIDKAPTARAGIETMLRATADAFSCGSEPHGCMIVLAAPQKVCASEAASDILKQQRLENIAILERRLQRALREGELPAGTDCRAIATFYATVQHGMSLQARDGADLATLNSIVDCALAGWEALVLSNQTVHLGPDESI